MDACLDILTIEMYQVNTCVGRIARWQARLSGFVETSSPPFEASETSEDDEDSYDDDDDDDDDADASSSSFDEIST